MSMVAAKPLSLTVQLMHLRREFPAGSGAVVRDKLVWIQKIRPHPLFHEYLCRIEYVIGLNPKVFVLDPPLTTLAAGRDLPHVRTHEEPIALCLFVYHEACWNGMMILAKVVVPMTYFWLASFEEWLFSGEWRGGGTHSIEPSAPTVPPIFPADLDHRRVA